MSKRDYRNPPTTFTVEAHSLSESAKSKLLDVLGYGDVDLFEESVREQLPTKKILRREPGEPIVLHDNDGRQISSDVDVGRIVLDIERSLGLLAHGAQYLDEMPRPADYVGAFRPLGRRAFEFYNDLCSLSDYYTDQLAAEGVDVQATKQAVVAFADAAAAIAKKFAALPSKGAKKNTALTEVTHQLRRIFRDSYRGPITPRTHRGAFVFPAEQEKRELDFVHVALCDVRRIPQQRVARLLRDPRCALPGERARVIKRIARSGARRRKRKQKTDV